MGPDSSPSGPSHRWQRAIFRWGIWNVCYRAWINLHVGGWENVPAENPVIIIGNHIGALDPGVMISFYPGRDIVPLAKVEAFSQPILRFFVRHWGAIPVNRGEADMKALKAAFDVIEQGDILMLYAEGTRSKTGLIEGQEGTAYFPVKSNAIVVPVGIWGSRGFPNTWFHDLKRTEVFLRFGQPFKFKTDGRKLPRDHFRQMTDEAMYRIACLLPEEWRGVYSDLSKATTNFLDFDFHWAPVAEALPHTIRQFRPAQM